MPTATDTSLTASDLRVAVGQLIRRLRTEHRFPLVHASVLGRLDREQVEGADVSEGIDTASRSKRRYCRAARISSLGFTSCERL